jgi:hypothetical protein
MSKTKRTRRTRRATPDRAATVDVVTQLEVAVRRPQATLIGAVVGGLVPWFASTLAHKELPATWSAGNHSLAMVMLAVVMGCALFSALTVYKFGRATFGDTRKALGFTLALEGVMLISTGTTSTVALVTLIVINALANGSVIALARDATCQRREADARRAATRARNREASRPARPSPAPVVEQRAEPTRRPARKSAPSVVWAPRWDHADVIDAEIVSEKRLLA